MTTSTASGIAPRTVEPGPAVHDFDFYMGSWWVRHRRLKERLAGSDEWEEFEGTSRAWPILDGAGNIDDNVVELPGGTYRAISSGPSSPGPSAGRSGGWMAGRPGASTRPSSAGSRMASAPSSVPIPSTDGRSSCASCGPISPRRRAAGSRRSRSTTARRGRSTGSWSRPGSSESPKVRGRLLCRCNAPESPAGRR